MEAFRSGFPARLAADRVRVLKQNRGCSNQGVWKVEVENPVEHVDENTLVSALEARESASRPSVGLAEFMSGFDPYLSGGGPLIDQAFQLRAGDGLVRCYMCQNKVIGFSEQFSRSRALGDLSSPGFGMVREKTMHEETALQFQRLRRSMEDDWVPGLQALLNIETGDLPAFWTPISFTVRKPVRETTHLFFAKLT